MARLKGHKRGCRCVACSPATRKKGMRALRKAKKNPRRRRNPKPRPRRLDSSGSLPGRSRRSKVYDIGPRLPDVWIERSTPDEVGADPKSPYRMVTKEGARFALSTLDAVRLQKTGVPFLP